MQSQLWPSGTVIVTGKSRRTTCHVAIDAMILLPSLTSLLGCRNTIDEIDETYPQKKEKSMVDRKLLTLVPALAALLAAAPALAAEGDAAKGEKVFGQCKICHSVEKGRNMIGPSLAGVVGRKAGGVEGFKYSDAMTKSGMTWTEENLEKYLKSPREFIPGNKMTFAGLKKEEDVDDVIAYLKTKSQ
jgi:cytochrome c